MSTEAKVVLHDEPGEYLPEPQKKDHEKAIGELTRQATELTVCDSVTEKQMAEILGRAKQRKDGLDQFRQAIVGPFNQHIRRINAFFGQIAEKYNPVIDTASRKLSKWRSDEEARIAKEKAQQQKDLQAQNKSRIQNAKDKDIDPNLLVKKTSSVTETPKSVQADSSRLTYRDVLRYEISPAARANPCKLVPKEYISLDEQKIAAAVRGKIIPVGDHKFVRVWIEKQPISVKI